MTDTSKLQSALHDGEPRAQTPSLAARVLGSASTHADTRAAEVPHAELDTVAADSAKTAHLRPAPAPAAAASEQTGAEIPQVAQGDDDRPLDPDTQDLGWAVYEQDIAQPLLSGLKNRDLWILERRFNKQTFRVRRVDVAHPSLAAEEGAEEKVRLRAEGKTLNGLDCNIADEHEFSPDRLRATLERLYTSVVLPLAALFKHLARLRSWHEARRSALFAVGYALAWALDKTLLAILLLCMLLIVSPRSRRILFPPAPLAAISATSGKPKVPEAQHLGSTQSLTGAAETYKGQAAEREAANFVNSLSSLAVSTAIGSEESTPGAEEDDLDGFDDEETVVEHGPGGTGSAVPRRATTKVGSGSGAGKKDKDGSSSNSSSRSGALADAGMPDPSKISGDAGAGSGGAKTKPGTDPSRSADGADETAAPVDRAVWAKAAPVLYVLEDICDTFERFGNALSPIPPFPQRLPRLRLAGVLAPLALAGATFLHANLVYRATTLGAGIGFFGQPVFDRLKPEPILAWLDEHVPHWRRYLELRNTILRGVPTNAQLTVTLLRIGEAHKSPLPPPPLPIVPEELKKKEEEGMDGPPRPEMRKGVEMADHPDLPPEYREELRRKALEKQHEEGNPSEGDASASAADEEKKEEKKEKKPSKVLGMFKLAAKSLTNSALGVNRAEATVLGSEHAKARLGVVRRELAESAVGDGPAAFKARYRGKKGLVIVSTSSTTPCVSFEPRQPAVARAAIAAVENFKAKEREGEDGDEDGDGDGEEGATPSATTTTTATATTSSTDAVGQSSSSSSATKRALEKAAEATRVPPLFSIQIEDIVDLSKRGGLGWKAKMLVSWALESDIADGLEILTKTGERFRITAMPRRDEVFNRLIALSPKTSWELA
ncbi:hypothetical protein OC844_001827 [Tilletia horrida]|nr:hypothetical protein OC844_001827 [Tilletia horrida]